jgi:uncharacterized protein (TIGR03086 family)
MTTTAAATELGGGVALLERATGYTLGSLPLVTPEALASPTPCRGWDLRTLLRHLNDSLQALHGAVTSGHVALDPAEADGDPEPRNWEPTGSAANPVATVRSRAGQMIGAWASPRRPGEIWIADLPLSAEIVAATGAVEVAVHGWDVARACGYRRPIPPALAEELLELCPLIVGDADRPARFAAPVRLPTHTSPSDRLVAFLGRCPC